MRSSRPGSCDRRGSPLALNTIGAGLAGLTLASNRALGLFDVTIKGNVVEHNDLAYDTTAADPDAACASSPTDSDDCGEGIHLLGTSDSRVIGNHVAHNVGGILVSDGGFRPRPAAPRRSARPRAT